MVVTVEMFRSLLLIITLLSVSCVQRAICPVTTKNGAAIFMELPNAPSNINHFEAKHFKAVDQKLLSAVDPKDGMNKYFPGLDPVKLRANFVVFSVNGQAQLKSGKKFIAHTPLAGVQAYATKEQVERAARLLATDMYQVAVKNYKVHTASECIKNPKK